MPRLASFAVLLLACLSATACAQPYTVDPAHTSVVFSVGHLGYSFCYGMFRETSGSVVFDPSNPKACKFELRVKVASISTGNEKRDQHLLNPDFFDAEEFPTITFVGAPVAAERDDKGRTVYQVAGELTMHGLTKEILLPMRLLNAGKDHQGKHRVGFHCETAVKRSDYGMDTSLGPISDNIGVTFSFEAAQP